MHANALLTTYICIISLLATEPEKTSLTYVPPIHIFGSYLAISFSVICKFYSLGNSTYIIKIVLKYILPKKELLNLKG